ncbi:MAG: MFS transporter, partial [Candidatus Nealsonbacteria bacterium]|nr:MFS transporter [Candidatus Nealsonbacteria bacterium]
MENKSPQAKREESLDKKNIWFLGLVSFINDTSSKIILPILPLFIKQIGGGGFALGLVSGLGESIASLFKIIAGYWSDKTGKRKPFVFGGYSLSALFKFLFGFAESWPQVLFFKSGERLGKGLRSAPRDAILAASTKKEKRGKGFGIHRALVSDLAEKDVRGTALGTFHMMTSLAT